MLTPSLPQILHPRRVVLAWTAALTLASLAVSARAEPATPPSTTDPATRTTDASGPAIALGVSLPLAWLDGSFGASAYVGLGHHHAVRANFARYEPIRLSDLAAVATGGDSPAHGGWITDLGIGWVWYPRRLWDGFTLEVGAIRRDRDTFLWPEFDPRVETRSTTYAGRAMIGWSWLIKGHVFVAVAAGGSVGYESGHETITPDAGGPMSKVAIARPRGDAELYLRFGFALGH
jgi:hypothetical protein